jgi:hypothetical protein
MVKKQIAIVRAGIWLKKKWENYVTRKAVEKANDMFNKTGSKILVLWYKGRPLVKSKQHFKELIKRGEFVKGMTIQDIENMAIYKTR